MGHAASCSASTGARANPSHVRPDGECSAKRPALCVEACAHGTGVSIGGTPVGGSAAAPDTGRSRTR
jgi:hypothetical protein